MVTIHVQYCGGWGYKRYYDALCLALDDEFGSGVVKTTFTADPGTTGNFEITLVETGELIHSKKNGKGRCESEEERQALFARIKAAM